MSDIKTEVIVNGSWRASCDMCFQGIDEDTSSVRVLLLLLFMRIDRSTCIYTFWLSISFSFFKCSSSSIVVCCLFTCIDRPLLHIPSSSLYFFSFFFQFNWWRRNWVRYLCVRQSIVHILSRFFKCSYGRQCNKKNEKKQTLIMIRFHCHYMYTIEHGKKL